MEVGGERGSVDEQTGLEDYWRGENKTRSYDRGTWRRLYGSYD